MTEFWKSGERHFCTFCKCWLAGNKISIDLHESGNHHKSMVKAKLETLRKANIEKERQEKQLSNTLGKMERAANESFRRDMASNSMIQSNNSPTSSDSNLPSKLKRPANQAVQVQCKKAKFVIKTPTPKIVYEPLTTPLEHETKHEEEEQQQQPRTQEDNDNETKFHEEQIKDLAEQIKNFEDNDNHEEQIRDLAEQIKNLEEEEEEVITTNHTDQEGIWYESKTDNQETFYWNDTTGDSTWTPPPKYLSIKQQKEKGLKV
ncbi:unnamed protein product [Adineta steineri]|uniref:WW domain-containing protein n=1 Tax=Adineta steineri TaxID=433720 RepID=A0A818WGH9_9BILA|nr:unnamed protein product [Adineta steineri]